MNNKKINVSELRQQYLDFCTKKGIMCTYGSFFSKYFDLICLWMPIVSTFIISLAVAFAIDFQIINLFEINDPKWMIITGITAVVYLVLYFLTVLLLTQKSASEIKKGIGNKFIFKDDYGYIFNNRLNGYTQEIRAQKETEIRKYDILKNKEFLMFSINNIREEIARENRTVETKSNGETIRTLITILCSTTLSIWAIISGLNADSDLNHILNTIVSLFIMYAIYCMLWAFLTYVANTIKTAFLKSKIDELKKLTQYREFLESLYAEILFEDMEKKRERTLIDYLKDMFIK